jgi:hypothetical protein
MISDEFGRHLPLDLSRSQGPISSDAIDLPSPDAANSPVAPSSAPRRLTSSHTPMLTSRR